MSYQYYKSIFQTIDHKIAQAQVIYIWHDTRGCHTDYFLLALLFYAENQASQHFEKIDKLSLQW